MNTTIVYEPSQTTHWKNLFPSKTLLLGSHNLNPGEELVAEIIEVNIQEIKNQNGKTERVPVLTFTNAPPMVLNITNSRTIATLYGENYDNWESQRIQIYATEVKAFGELQTALRIRPTVPSETINISEYEKQLRACESLAELQKVFMGFSNPVKAQLSSLKDELKGKLK